MKKFKNSKKKSPKVLKNSHSKRFIMANETQKIQPQSARFNIGSTRVNLDQRFLQSQVKNTTCESNITPRLSLGYGTISQKDFTTNMFDTTYSYKKNVNEKKVQNNVRSLKTQNILSDKTQIKSYDKR